MSVALLAVFLAAWFEPSVGLEDGLLFPGKLSFVAVFVIFLIQGWKLNLGRLKEALTDLRTLFFLHSFIYLVPGFVVLGIREMELVEQVWNPGLFFLAILPTTISSCVVYTRLAGGGADEALGHATFSNLFAMLWVPLVVFGDAFGFFDFRGAEDKSGVSFELIPDFMLMVFLPVLIGWWGKNKLSRIVLPENSFWSNEIPAGCILLLAYFSFCSLFAEFGNELLGPSMGMLAAVVFVLLLIVTALAWALAGFVCRSRKARVTFFFCGAQKSLALGLPLAQTLFVFDGNSFGLLVLPLAIFHLGQLFLGAFLIGPLSRWANLR